MRRKILSVEQEPAPYKFDLWNAAKYREDIEVEIIFTTKKNWAKDGGHNYQELPTGTFNYCTLLGRGLLGKILSAVYVLKRIGASNPDLVLVMGYSEIPQLLASFLCAVKGVRFVVFCDSFDNTRPSGINKHLKALSRKVLRSFLFRFAFAILVCGKAGSASAREAGCPARKIKNYPYTVDIGRMTSEKAIDLPKECLGDLRAQKIIFMFSGRMIERKGLKTLLDAAALLPAVNWVIWVEGDGPKLSEYKQYCESLRLKDKVRFLGFCQHPIHSWLLLNSDVVCVPSHEDHWGIVVDEAIQAFKPVISTTATGSALDRIRTGSNGFLVAPKNVHAFAQVLQRFTDEKYLSGFKSSLPNPPITVTPSQNLDTLSDLVTAG